MNLVRQWCLAMIALVTCIGTSGAVNAEVSNTTGEYAAPVNLKKIAAYSSGAGFDEAGAEIVTYHSKLKKAYVVNGAEKSLDILDLSTLTSQQDQMIKLEKRIHIESLDHELSQVGDITSVAIHPSGEYLAVAAPAVPKQEDGYVVFIDVDGDYISHVEVGALPDMVTLSPNGHVVLTANEGEPSDDYTVDPDGTVSLIDVSTGIEHVDQEDVTTLKFDQQERIDADVRLAKPGSSREQDVEPEYIAVSPDSKTAYVVLQENNAIATIDLVAKQITQVKSLGYKDHSVAHQGLDASDEDNGIHIRPWPVLGLYLPDGIDVFVANDRTYLVTANEGDTRDYDGFSEETRVEDLADVLDLKADKLQGFNQTELDALLKEGLAHESQLGRLKVTTTMGRNAEGKYETLFSFGGRSFSIWDAETMELVFDSGDSLEQVIAKEMPEHFNVSNDNNDVDDRSDDKGPEPEDIEIGLIGNQIYAFIGLERQGGIIVYNITDPAKSEYVGYFLSREFNGDTPQGDIAPEGLKFVTAEESPTGEALLIAAHEVSGTVAVYEVAGTPRESKSSHQYRVKRGDTLWAIAQTYGTTWQRLQTLNQLDNPHLIYPNQIIKLP